MSLSFNVTFEKKNMNSAVSSELLNLSNNPNITWIDQIISIHKDVQNPFITSSFSQNKFEIDSTSSFKSLVDMYCKPGLELDVDISDEHISEVSIQPQNQNITNLSSTSLFQKSAPQQTAPIQTPFSFRSSSSYFHLSPTDNASYSSNQSKYLTFQLVEFKSEFQIIEPIICYAFLYSRETTKIISDYWHFSFDSSIQEMKANGINYECFNDVAFQVDSNQKEKDLYLFVILSHPLTVDNSNEILKYYQNPTENNKKGAIKNLKESFPRNKIAFSQFAWTYLPVDCIETKKNVLPPNFFITEKPILESNIPYFIEEASLGKFKQMQANILFSKCYNSNNIISQKLNIKPQPYLAPIHQLIVSLESANINSSFVSGRNILIKVQLKTTESGEPIKCFYSQLSPAEKDSSGYSSCFYHEKMPQFNDYFVIDLPFPLSNTSYLSFEVLHVHAKKNDSLSTLIGESTYQLVKDGLVCTGQHIELPLRSNDTKQSKIVVSVALRSSFSTDDANLLELRKTGDLSILKKLSDEQIIKHLMEILEMFVRSFARGPTPCNFDILFRIQEAANNLIPFVSFEKYLIVFARYFAMKDSTPIRGVMKSANVSLKELSRKKTPIKELDIKATDELISLDWTTPPPSLKTPANHNRSSSLIGVPDAPSITVHTKIIRALIDYLKEKPLANISHFIDFLFTLCIKSIAVNPLVLFDGFDEMCTLFSKASGDVHRGQWRPYISYGVFALMLFDLGFAEESSKAIITMLNVLSSQETISEQLVAFIDFTFRPTTFIMFLRYSEQFKETVIGILKEALTHQTSNSTRQFVKIILRCCSFYQKDMNIEIASCFIKTLNQIHANRLPSLTEASSLVSLLVFIISNASSQSLKEVDQQRILGIAHYLLSNVNSSTLAKRDKSKEAKRPPIPIRTRQRTNTVIPKQAPLPLIIPEKNQETDKILIQVHTGIIQFILNNCQITPVDKPDPLVGLTYHMILSKIDESLFPVLCGMITTMIKYFAPFIFSVSSPPLSKVLWKLIQILHKSSNPTAREANIFAQPFKALFEIDHEKTGNNNRSTVIAMRALSLLTDEEMTDPSLLLLFESIENSSNKAIRSFSACYKNIRNNCYCILNKKVDPDYRITVLMQRVILLRTCPDAQLEILDKVAESHLKNDYKVEYFCVLMFKAIFVLEYGTIIKTIPNLFGVLHCSTLFCHQFPLGSKCKCPSAYISDLPLIPGFCSNQFFTQEGFISILETCFEYGMNNGLLESIASLIEYAWPLFEYSRFYGEVETMFSRFAQVFETIATNPPSPEMFFRVEMSGEVFGEDNGMSYIYHANKFTKIFALSDQIIKTCTEVYGAPIESIQTQLGKPDPDKGYIKVTVVYPYTKHTEASFGTLLLYDKFFYENPFVPGSNKLQGGVEDQWIRRTIVKTQIPVPSVLRRVPILPEEVRIKEIEPIRVAYRQIRERTAKIDEAISSQDFQTLQQLLHGSLLVQVNEGPAKIAEVFMKGDSKYVNKLKFEFGKFIEACERGVKKHAELATSNQALAALQEEYESSFDTLKENITKLINQQ